MKVKKREPLVTQGKVRSGNVSNYLYGQLTQLKVIPENAGKITVWSRFSENILVFQEFSEKFTEQLTEQEYFVFSTDSFAESVLNYYHLI